MVILCHFLLRKGSFSVISCSGKGHPLSFPSQERVTLCHFLLKKWSFSDISFSENCRSVSFPFQGIVTLCHFLLSEWSFSVVFLTENGPSQGMVVLCHFLLGGSSFSVISFSRNGRSLSFPSQEWSFSIISFSGVVIRFPRVRFFCASSCSVHPSKVSTDQLPAIRCREFIGFLRTCPSQTLASMTEGTDRKGQ